VADELLHQIGQRGAGIRDPALALEEAALTLARKQGLAVVELADEVEALAQRLRGVEQPKPGSARPGGERASPQGGGDRAGAPGRDRLGQAERERRSGVDRAPERDHAAQALTSAQRGRLVTEHSALRVAGEVHIATRRPPQSLDRVVHTHDVVGKRAIQSTGFVLGRTEVDDVGRHAVPIEDRDGARRRRDVVHLGAQHQRRDEEHGRALDPGAVGEIAPQAVDRPLGDDVERRWLLTRLQAPEADHLERVLGRGPDPPDRPRYRPRRQRQTCVAATSQRFAHERSSRSAGASDRPLAVRA
jgi:hypothetical protein